VNLSGLTNWIVTTEDVALRSLWVVQPEHQMSITNAMIAERASFMIVGVNSPFGEPKG
jgi:hypothetical protein